MEFRSHTLDNGLEIVAECSPSAYSMGLGFFVKTGARDETPQESGVSHFLEHMLFKGTARRSAADVNRELDEIGSHANAYTSEDRTVYYANILPEYQERALDILSDMMRPALREDDFEMEKQVIIEEICKYEDQPPFNAHEKAMAAYFEPHPMGNNVLGTVESVSALTVDAMRDYFHRRYSPSNIVLAAAGNVDFNALCRKAEEDCGDWENYPSQRDLSPATGRRGLQVVHKPMARQEYLVQISAGPTTDDLDRYPMRMMSTIVGDDSGSRLYWELVETGHAEAAAMWPYDYQGVGLLMTYMSCAPEQAADNLRRLADIQQTVEAKGVTEEELEQAKAKISSHIVLRSERPASRMFSVGGAWIQRGEYRSVRQALDAYEAVTLDDVHRVLKKYPLSHNMTVAVGPLEKLDAS